MNKNLKNNGFMMVEILVASSIICLSMLAVTLVAEKSITISHQSFHSSQAGFLLEEGAEAMRILRDNSWSNISTMTAGTTYYLSFSGGTWTVSSTPNTIGIFTRTVTISNVNRDNSTKDISATGTNDAGTKLVTVTVSWTEGTVVLSKTLQFYIANIF